MTKYKPKFIKLDIHEADQLLYDLLNNITNDVKKADIAFDKLKDTEINLLHYIIVKTYLDNTKNDYYMNLSNNIQHHISILALKILT